MAMYLADCFKDFYSCWNQEEFHVKVNSWKCWHYAFFQINLINTGKPTAIVEQALE